MLAARIIVLLKCPHTVWAPDVNGFALARICEAYSDRGAGHIGSAHAVGNPGYGYGIVSLPAQ